MKKLFFVFLTLLVLGSLPAGAQVVPAAVARQFTVVAGGIASGFEPGYGPNKLLGVGAFVDLKFTRWVQVEAEGRWLRINQFDNIYEDHYLIGPRVPIHTFWRATPYGKVLIGDGKMNFQFNYAHGSFTDIAYGGGLDIRLTRRISVRAVDFEYQQWPKWVNSSLYPYGASVGISYRVLGGR